MPFAFSGRKKFGPFTLHFGKRGVTSVSSRSGRSTWRLWSRRSRPGLSSVDLPGPLSYRPRARRKTEAR